jgi:hypothetical protein
MLTYSRMNKMNVESMETPCHQVFMSSLEINKILNYPEPSTFRCIEKVYNREVLNVLTSLNPTVAGYNKIPDALYAQNIDDLKRLKTYYKREGHIVDYAKTSTKKGRYYISNKNTRDYVCLQSCYGKVRRLLIDGNLKAIDLCNAHLEIIKNLCRILKVPTQQYATLTEYSEKREDILKDIMSAYSCDRKTAKEYFIIQLFGGGYNTWLSECRLVLSKAVKTDFMERFEREFEFIKYQIQKLDVFNGFKALEKQVNKKQGKKLDRTALAIFLQEIESKIFIVMKNFLETRGCVVEIGIHDGIWFVDVKGICNDELLVELQEEILKELGMHIPVDYEDTAPTADDITWFENHQKFLEDNMLKTEALNTKEKKDIIYARNILKHFEGRMYNVFSNLVIYDEDTGMWYIDSQLKVLRRCCIKHCNKLFPVLNEGDEKKEFDTIFSKVSKNVISLTPDNDEFFNNDNQIGYLLFNNGVLDMKKFELLSFDPKYRFTRKINRDFDTARDYTDGYKQIFDRLYNKQFTDTEKRDYFLQLLSRGVAGEYKDRVFGTMIGETACGKGKQTTLLSNAFEGYIGTFSGEELLVKKNSHSEVAGLSFILSIYDRQVGISNELKLELQNGKSIVGLDCNLAKKLVSGGDKFPVREIYMKTMEVVNKSRPFFLLNAVPYTVGVDEAYIDRANYINYDRSSKAGIEADNDTYFQQDRSIDDFVSNAFIVDSFIYLICKHYADSCINMLPKPDSVIATTNEATGFNNTKNYFEDNYKILEPDVIKSYIRQEKNKNGICLVDGDKVDINWIKSDTVFEKYVIECNTTTKTDLTKKLAQKGIIVAEKKILGKTCKIYVGMREYTDEEREEMDK